MRAAPLLPGVCRRTSCLTGPLQQAAHLSIRDGRGPRSLLLLAGRNRLLRDCCSACMQVVVFDLEYGQPAASTTLPASRPAFKELLGCYGHAAVGKGLDEAGVDLMYACHQARMPAPASPAACCELAPMSGALACFQAPLSRSRFPLLRVLL